MSKDYSLYLRKNPAGVSHYFIKDSNDYYTATSFTKGSIFSNILFLKEGKGWEGITVPYLHYIAKIAEFSDWDDLVDNYPELFL